LLKLTPSQILEDQSIVVNPNFIGCEEDLVGINPDNINISTD
jgi:hypothetical protein